MENQERYVVCSLELHLFFARIMKEHALFLKAGFSPVDASCAREAEFFKVEFEKLLCQAIRLGDGVVSKNVLCSGEIVTEFTACAEQQTCRFTGICINGELTEMELRLRCGESCGENGRENCGECCISAELCRQVKQLNRSAICLLDGLIALKESVLCKVLSCKMFTMNYPLLIEHIIREAKHYRKCICNLESGMDADRPSMQQTEQFWNQIMMEHALFIRGQLDPSECELIDTAGAFAEDYARLLKDCSAMNSRTGGDSEDGTSAVLAETVKFRDFKAAGTKGIEDCKIRSTILPLLADHVLREANHYIRMLC